MFTSSQQAQRLTAVGTLIVLALALMFPQLSVAAVVTLPAVATPYERAQAYLASLTVAPAPQSTLPPAAPMSEPQSVPFYSQFTDITKPGWQKVGCGIASIAMLIDYYRDDIISVDVLLERGIARNAFLSDAGWTHNGLISLARDYELDGESRSLAHLSTQQAMAALTDELKAGPVMASVHYTFEPTNPIPHLVVINDIKDGLVYYNDPAEAVGSGTLSVEKFSAAWKKRYIVVRPV